MPLITLDLTLTLSGPFLTQSSTPRDYGVDAVLARDNLERFYIPGTSLVGVLRKAWKELFGDDFINDWLGQEQHSDSPKGSVLPRPKRLYIGDLALMTIKKEANRKTTYRIRIDEERGSVAEGAYLVVETPFAPGELVQFQGQVRFLANDAEDTNKVIRCLHVGLNWISQLGAYCTVGFGELVKVTLKPAEEKKDEKFLALSSCCKYDLVIRPQSPFCIAERHLAGNKLFKSSEVIPGNVIKGTLANFWKRLLGRPGETKINEEFDSTRRELGRYFDDLRITHAFPGKNKVRPVQYPLSWVKVGDSFCDVALSEMTNWIASHTSAPAFAVDWKGKDYSEVNKLFGWPSLTKELRIRTAINAETRRSSDEQLFAYEMVVPTGGMEWYARLEMSAVPESDRGKVVEQLRSLIAGGVVGLGKTKAYAQLELLDSESIRSHCPSQMETRNELWVVTLQTPALLCSPENLTDSNSDRQAALFTAYCDTFTLLSKASLVLQRFFAKQSLAGGYYLWKRFQYIPNYEPWLLTDAGSVFVLCPRVGKEKEAQRCVEKWFNTGLPVPSWAVDKYQLGEKPASYWKKCPFIPQHGFGEIAVNVEARGI
jgi:hypothetical protein